MRTATAVIIVIVVMVLYYFTRTRFSYICNTSFCWNVVEDFHNKEEAAALISEANERLLRFMRVLIAKYQIDAPDSENPAKDTDKYKIIKAIVTNYNPYNVRENDPRWTSETSYTVDKGREIHVCLRSKADPNKLTDINTLMYVLLHEIGGHIGNYNGWGHNTRFWSIFKFIIGEAYAAGIYYPADYDKNPVMYCGMKLNYQPYNDHSLV